MAPPWQGPVPVGAFYRPLGVSGDASKSNHFHSDEYIIICIKQWLVWAFLMLLIIKKTTELHKI